MNKILKLYNEQQEELISETRYKNFWRIMYWILALITFILVITNYYFIYDNNQLREALQLYDDTADKCISGFKDSLNHWITCEQQRTGINFTDNINRLNKIEVTQ